MKVKALVGFAAVLNGETVGHAQGSEFELPAEVDWLRAGLVEAVNESADEPAEDAPQKPAARKRASKKGA